MRTNLNIFLNKKILIYGLGLTGLSVYKFLKNKSNIFLFDDFSSKNISLDLKKKTISYKEILKSKFDRIILSPGIDVNNCKLTNYLKKNHKIIFSDLDVFYNFYKNNCITITGTNGKSTTCQLLYEILLKQKFDVRLVGNIGNPILSSKNIKRKTIFIVEASSYQLEYSKLFKTKYAVILNLSPDHLDRHKTLKNYVKAKFKLLSKQSKKNISFVKKNDPLIEREIKTNKFKSKIIKVDTKEESSFLKKINNIYFQTETNKENLSFILKISKQLKLRNRLLAKSVQSFRGLKYRQQIIFKKKNLTIINDSKSTSFSSSIGILKTNENIYWLIGGIYKKGDKFNLPREYLKNIKAFIYGKNKHFFNKELKDKIEYKNFKNIKDALNKIFIEIKKNKFKKQTILFSPSAASFDSFKNFEERGLYFNKLIKNYLNGI